MVISSSVFLNKKSKALASGIPAIDILVWARFIFYFTCDLKISNFVDLRVIVVDRGFARVVSSYSSANAIKLFSFVGASVVRDFLSCGSFTFSFKGCV